MKYLQMPCEMGEKGEPELDQHIRNFRDNFSVKTTVCSTQLTQDGEWWQGSGEGRLLGASRVQ